MTLNYYFGWVKLEAILIYIKFFRLSVILVALTWLILRSGS